MTVNTHGASNRCNRQRAGDVTLTRTVNADVMAFTGRQDDSSPIKLRSQHLNVDLQYGQHASNI